ncbi:hypothetical protein DSO57_1009887 [Entomophthora muscae]|uniref:Uncharacterized protein n=1 Tax=Entomophthora muscae TaxID=34485 RepID=A0ACC2T6Q8_9FUNG|nr:hypothetical protein DSO57_1009887 [Entomophthora muscae]
MDGDIHICTLLNFGKYLSSSKKDCFEIMEFPDPLPEIIADLAPSPTPDTDPGPTDVSTTELVSAQAPAPTCEIISDPALVLEAKIPPSQSKCNK